MGGVQAMARMLEEGERQALGAELAQVPGWEGVLAVAEDGCSNYAVLFQTGDLAGMVAIFDHEEPRPVPAFPNVQRFLEVLRDGPDAVDLVALERDFPRVRAADPVTSKHERVLFDRRRAAFIDRDDPIDAFVALALAPLDDEDALGPFFASTDMWVREEACRTIARIRPHTAVPVLERAALEGPAPNVPTACIAALRALATPEAAAALARLKARLPQYPASFFTTLQRTAAVQGGRPDGGQ